jgi:long-chain acyl-CoA synthetase
LSALDAAASRHLWERSYPAGLDWSAPIPPRPLFALLEDAAKSYGDRPCIDFLGKRYTYAEIARSVKRVASGLQGIGVGPGVAVALLLPNCPQYVITFFAVLEAGGTVVNCNPLEAEREIARQIRETGAEVLVAPDVAAVARKIPPPASSPELRRVVLCRMADALPGPRALLAWAAALPLRIWMAQDERVIDFRDLAGAAPAVAAVEVDPSRAIAVLQYTGGTTGAPKAVALSHANLHANAMQIARWFTNAVPGSERILAVLPFFHAFGLTAEMNLALSLGAELVLLPRFRLAEVVRAIARKRVTIFIGVPTIFRAVAEMPGLSRADFAALKAAISGGDALPAMVQAAFEERTGCPLLEGYGLTECSPVVACNPAEGGNRRGSVGLPLPGTVVEILSLEDGRTVVPPGETGEVCVAGPQVMQGYFGEPAATARVLANGRMRTGDLGFLDLDGYLHLAGRLKEMITTSGVHVYPPRIEEVLRHHPVVADAAVIGAPDPRRGQSVEAHVVARRGVPLDEAALRAFLADKLSRHEIPRRIVICDELPKSPIGKVLKRELEMRKGAHDPR